MHEPLRGSKAQDNHRKVNRGKTWQQNEHIDGQKDPILMPVNGPPWVEQELGEEMKHLP